MTARPHYSPADRARALALAEAIGPTEAAHRLNMRVSTITGWRSKAKADPEAFDVEVELGDGLLEEATGAFSLAELEALQRRIGRQLDAALAAGKTNDARNLGILFGIAYDKIAKRQETERVERGGYDPDRPADVTHARRELAEVLESLTFRRIGGFANASVDDLRVQVQKERREMAVRRARIRFLLDEMLIRRKGLRSQFAGMTKSTLPPPWQHFDDDDFADTFRVTTVRTPAPAPSPYTWRSGDRPPVGVAIPDARRTQIEADWELRHGVGERSHGEGVDHVEQPRDVVTDGEAAVVTSIKRARRRSSYGRSVQERMLIEQGVDPSAFQPPRGA